MSPEPLLMLDTSVLIHILRGKSTGKAIDAAYGLRARSHRPLLSTITVGELLSFAAQRGWGEAKLDAIKKMAEELVIVDIRSEAVLKRYAEIDAFLVNAGRRIGDNDTWIAATAAATGATLVTTDKDFDALDGRFLTRIWFDPAVAAPV